MMDAPTIHVIGLPHTETVVDEYSWCAYTQKIRRFCDMLTGLGRKVILYAGTRNEAAVHAHVTLVNDHDRKTWFGDWDHLSAWDGFDVSKPWWQEMNAAAIRQIRYRAEPGDVLGIIAGTCQKPIADALPHLLPVEWGIGYSGVFAPYRVFESNAWMHYLYGRDQLDGRFYDAVIPNAFDPDEFIYREQKSDYLLFLSRHIPRKGIAVVEEIAKHHRVITAGQATEPIPGTEYVGVVGPKERAELLADARALLCPTLYVEPFGGVVVEAGFSGTPVITTPWGAFSETVIQGVTGQRCSTLRQFLRAVDWLDGPRPSAVEILHRTEDRYSTKVVAQQYDGYLDQLATLHGKGWYA